MVSEEKRQRDKEEAVMGDLEIHGLKDGSIVFISKSKNYDLLWRDALNALRK